MPYIAQGQPWAGPGCRASPCSNTTGHGPGTAPWAAPGPFGFSEVICAGHFPSGNDLYAFLCFL